MQTHTNAHEGKMFITILADGKLHQTVPEGTEGAVVRKYEDKDGVEQQKIELVHDSVSGKITKIGFESGDYGKSIQIELDNEGVISIGTKTNFGEDIMKKIPAIDLSKEVKIAPHSLNDEKGKSRKGVTVYQDGEKVESFYWDKDSKKSINGIPDPEGDTKSFDSDDWTDYFTTVRKFLMKQVEAIITEKFFEPTNEVENQTNEVSLEDF